MPSDAKKKRDAKKKEATKNRDRKNISTKVECEETVCSTHNGNGQVNGTDAQIIGTSIAAITKQVDEIDLAAEYRSVTGVLSSHADSMDLHFGNLSILFHGAELLVDSTLDLNVGKRYGLIGMNGCGKSSLLAVLANKEVEIPDHIDTFLLRREMSPSEKTALQCVIEVDEERHRLESEVEDICHRGDNESHERLVSLYDRLEELDASKATSKAAFILHGLGFTKEMQQTQVKHFSGGWRMRIALARALYIRPSLLLLDEPTNHLDLNACVWLEEELRVYPRMLVVISHSQDFMNGVCNSIIHMDKKRLTYYGGNYDSYVNTKMELMENQAKRYKWEQDQIAHMKNYIARFGHGSAKLARQAQSKEKTLKKMVDAGLAEKVTSDKALSFYFMDCDRLPPPVIQVQNVSFRYSDTKPYIYKDLDFGMDQDTRVALVGPNGAGKSTLLKLLSGELIPTDGLIRRHSHLKIGRYHQHLADQLDLDLSPLQYMMNCYPKVKEKEDMRKIIGRYGLTGQHQINPIRNLSDGQRCRVTFAWLARQCPHMLLLDEPTNHLDIDTIDALAEAIENFEGGMILVSHDFRLISHVAEEIWVCEKQTVTKWDGDILAYKEKLTKETHKQRHRNIEQ